MDLDTEVALTAETGAWRADNADRLRAMVSDHHEVLWRFLRRLGVPQRDVDDALQEVIWITARKLDVVEPGRERAFMRAVAFRVAGHLRRARGSADALPDDEMDEIADPVPCAEELTDQKRARLALDRILDRMPLDLRAAFVLYELEGLTLAEIAQTLGIAQGTVASRLRRARESFLSQVGRLQTAMSQRPAGEKS